MDAQKLLEAVNRKTEEKLGRRVIDEIEVIPNGKVKVYFSNGNVKWFINFYECFHSLNYQYNLKLAPVKTSFAKLIEEQVPNRESKRLATLKVRLSSEIQIIIDRYESEKLKYFKNTIYKEIRELFFNETDLLKLSKKEYFALRGYLYKELREKYRRSGYIVDILNKMRTIDYEELFE